MIQCNSHSTTIPAFWHACTQICRKWATTIFVDTLLSIVTIAAIWVTYISCVVCDLTPFAKWLSMLAKLASSSSSMWKPHASQVEIPHMIQKKWTIKLKLNRHTSNISTFFSLIIQLQPSELVLRGTSLMFLRTLEHLSSAYEFSTWPMFPLRSHSSWIWLHKKELLVCF